MFVVVAGVVGVGRRSGTSRCGRGRNGAGLVLGVNGISSFMMIWGRGCFYLFEMVMTFFSDYER